MKTLFSLLLILMISLFASCGKCRTSCPQGAVNGPNGVTTGTITVTVGHALIWEDPLFGSYGPGLIPPAIPIDLNGDGSADVNGFCPGNASGADLHTRIHNLYQQYINQYYTTYGVYPPRHSTYVEITFSIIHGADYYTVGADLHEINGIVQ